jgi:hypothetical protein
VLHESVEVPGFGSDADGFDGVEGVVEAGGVDGCVLAGGVVAGGFGVLVAGGVEEAGGVVAGGVVAAARLTQQDLL